MEQYFETVTSPKARIKMSIIIWIVEALVALLGLCVSLGAFIFFEVMVLMINLFILLLSMRVKCVMKFEGTALTCTELPTNRQIYFDSLRHCDFMFMQKESQKAQNCGNLKIIGTTLTYYDVQNFAEMKAYVDENFSN